MIIIRAEEFAKEDGLKTAEEIMTAEELLASVLRTSSYDDLEEALYEMGKKDIESLISIKMLVHDVFKKLIKEKSNGLSLP